MKSSRFLSIIMFGISVYILGVLCISIIKPDELSFVSGDLTDFSCDIGLGGDRYRLQITNEQGAFEFKGGEFGCGRFYKIEKHIGGKALIAVSEKSGLLRVLEVESVTYLDEKQSEFIFRVSATIVALISFGFSILFWRLKSW